MIYEMLRASCSDGVSELLKTWERESFKIIQEGVLAAWLSFDGYRLNNQIHKQAGELSYGLVLKHPVAIKRAASYLAGFTRQDEMQGLMSAKKISRCHNFAVERAMQRNPDKTKAQIELIVRPYQLKTVLMSFTTNVLMLRRNVEFVLLGQVVTAVKCSTNP